MRRLRDSRVQRPESLPAVGTLVNEPAYARLVALYGRPRVVGAIRAQVEAERKAGGADGAGRFELVEGRLKASAEPQLRRVINATGVILHTGLGRAPLAKAAVDALSVAGGYSNLELDLESGKRGERASLLAELLMELFGCDAAVVVNNNAAAVLLALTALCKGKEVIVSRGELVEIGGAFRMPDVMRLSGARMVEVGTTNRTRASDYGDAITPRTAALLHVHRSNFQLTGFTESTSLGDMARVSRERDVLLIDDLGSGASHPIGDEPTIAASLEHCDVVTFSGDKLLGGPQAGIVLGRGDRGVAAVKKMSRHPLARAVRVDKLTVAALEATVRLRLAERWEDIPVERMLRAPVDEIRRRAALWSVKLEERGVGTRLVEAESAVGGGSAPGESMPTVSLAIEGPATRLLDALRHGNPPVIARIEKDACCIDPRTVLRGEDETLIDAIEAAARTLSR